MRLGFILTVSFLLLAAVVALVGYLYKGTSDAVQEELASVRQQSIAAFIGAAKMAFALQESQLAAQQIISARLQGLVEPSHDTGPLPGLEDSIEQAEDLLWEFEKWLGRTHESLRSTPAPDSGQSHPSADREGHISMTESLTVIDELFAEYEVKMDRFAHLAVWHPTEQVSEYYVEELQPLVSEGLVPGIRDFEDLSRQVLTAELDRVETMHRRANRRNGFVAAASFLGALFLGLAIARSISRPLDALQEGVARVAEGELGTRVDISTTNEIGLVAEAFNRMVGELESTTVSRSYLDSIIQSVREMLVVADRDGRIRTVNRAILDALGYAQEDLVGESLDRLFGDGLVGVEPAGERAFSCSDGSSIPVYCSLSELRSRAGDLQGHVLVAMDLRQRKESEARLRASIAEKEVLLREVHHRVKNNLQIVSSLLNLQNSSEKQVGSVDRVLRDSRNRIRSMALIHEQLYKSEDLARIDFRAYVEELIVYLTRSFDIDRRRIEIVLDLERVLLSVDRAIPCGMIINELVSNGVEHAYPEGNGQIRVSFRRLDHRYRLVVEDDGVGLPPGLNPSTASTLGLRLIGALGEQLDAEVGFGGDRGTSVSVAFITKRMDPVEVTA